MIPLTKIKSFYKYGTSVCDTEDEMKEVCAWLDIPFEVHIKVIPPFFQMYFIERSVNE